MTVTKTMAATVLVLLAFATQVAAQANDEVTLTGQANVGVAFLVDGAHASVVNRGELVAVRAWVTGADGLGLPAEGWRRAYTFCDFAGACVEMGDATFAFNASGATWAFEEALRVPTSAPPGTLYYAFASPDGVVSGEGSLQVDPSYYVDASRVAAARTFLGMDAVRFADHVFAAGTFILSGTLYHLVRDASARVPRRTSVTSAVVFTGFLVAQYAIGAWLTFVATTLVVLGWAFVAWKRASAPVATPVPAERRSRRFDRKG